MNTTTFLLNYWHMNIMALVIVLIMILFHYISNGYRLTNKSPLYFSGVILFILVTFSPIDFLARNYLFSAHMIQHIVLLLIVPPLLLTGTDKHFLGKVVNIPFLRKILNFLLFPIVAWVLGVGSMWVMHIPSFMMDMHNSAFLTNAKMIILLILGSLFIWPVYSPVNFRKLGPLLSSMYLFLACVGCTVLGIFITFAPEGMFTAAMNYTNPVINNLVSLDWGISSGSDQMIGGLIMWVPACIIYLTNVMITLLRWFTTRSTENISNEVNL